MSYKKSCCKTFLTQFALNHWKLTKFRIATLRENCFQLFVPRFQLKLRERQRKKCHMNGNFCRYGLTYNCCSIVNLSNSIIARGKRWRRRKEKLPSWKVMRKFSFSLIILIAPPPRHITHNNMCQLERFEAKSDLFIRSFVRSSSWYDLW